MLPRSHHFSCSDERAGVIVGIFAGTESNEQDCERSIDAITRSDAAAARNNLPHVCVYVTSKETPAPPPVWRRRMAASNNQLSAQSHHFALVSPNVLIRGVFTAINWLTQPRVGHHLAAFATFDAAAEWVRGETGKPYPELEKLYAEARANLGREKAGSGKIARANLAK